MADPGEGPGGPGPPYLRVWMTPPPLSEGLDPSLGSLSSDVFERRTSTGSEPFSLLVSFYASVFVLPSVLILIETICPKICSKSRLKSANSLLPFNISFNKPNNLLPFNMRRSNKSLLKLPIGIIGRPRHSPFNSLSPDIH